MNEQSPNTLYNMETKNKVTEYNTHYEISKDRANPKYTNTLQHQQKFKSDFSSTQQVHDLRKFKLTKSNNDNNSERSYLKSAKNLNKISFGINIDTTNQENDLNIISYPNQKSKLVEYSKTFSIADMPVVVGKESTFNNEYELLESHTLQDPKYQDLTTHSSQQQNICAMNKMLSSISNSYRFRPVRHQ